jgi:hypothetical protein
MFSFVVVLLCLNLDIPFFFTLIIFRSLRQISLPPLIEDVEDRKFVASGIRQSRARYRLFRSRLSQEVSQSSGKFLPMPLS